jgi:hypothetical protein
MRLAEVLSGTISSLCALSGSSRSKYADSYFFFLRRFSLRLSAYLSALCGEINVTAEVRQDTQRAAEKKTNLVVALLRCEAK